MVIAFVIQSGEAVVGLELLPLLLVAEVILISAVLKNEGCDRVRSTVPLASHFRPLTSPELLVSDLIILIMFLKVLGNVLDIIIELLDFLLRLLILILYSDHRFGRIM